MMTSLQENAIRRALMDLIGAYQAYKHMNVTEHDWAGHIETIYMLAKAFPDIGKEFDQILTTL